jgi:hypothetical protein
MRFFISLCVCVCFKVKMKYGPKNMMDMVVKQMIERDIDTLDSLLSSNIIRDCVDVCLYRDKDRYKPVAVREYQMRRNLRDTNGYAYSRIRDG